MAATPVDVLRTGIARADRVLIVLAGPNGAGKSTFFDAFLAPMGIRFVNADLIARALAPDNPAAIAYEAADAAAEERRRLVAEGVSFCMETVFSDPVGDKLRFLQDAQEAGYTVFLVFIGIDNPELAVARVIQRVEDGGHDVPDVKIRGRFPRTIVNLQQTAPCVDFAYLFDNSSYDEPYRLVAAFERGWMMRRVAVLPAWAGDIPAMEGLCARD